MQQVNENPNATFNGTFSFEGTATGSAFADFLLGLPSNYTQTTGQRFYLRNRYAGAFAEDSWHARNNLTINVRSAGIWIRPWNEKYNSLQSDRPRTAVGAVPECAAGLVVHGDRGFPRDFRRRNGAILLPGSGLILTELRESNPEGFVRRCRARAVSGPVTESSTRNFPGSARESCMACHRLAITT